MRLKRYPVLPMLVALICLAFSGLGWAKDKDYDQRFIKKYPPGNYGMWYYTDRFTHWDDPNNKSQETYRWDKYMSNAANTFFPFYPVPYDWEYGKGRTFNLPDYNNNDWY